MIKHFIIAFVLASSLTAHADLSADKTAGTCAAYMSAQQKPKGTERALMMADNQDRAVMLAQSWISEVKRHSNDKQILQGYFIDADAECRKIGIRSSDY